MRKFNVAIIGGLLLCILLVISMLTGCANEEKTSEELSAIEKEWLILTDKDQTRVSKIEIGAYVTQNTHSSVAVVVQNIEVSGAERINLLLDILKQRDISFYDPDDYIVDDADYSNSKAGMKTIQIEFLDSDNQEIMKLNIYADNTGKIYKRALNPGGTQSWRLFYIVEFAQPIFDSVQSFYETCE